MCGLDISYISGMFLVMFKAYFYYSSVSILYYETVSFSIFGTVYVLDLLSADHTSFKYLMVPDVLSEFYCVSGPAGPYCFQQKSIESARSLNRLLYG